MRSVSIGGGADEWAEEPPCSTATPPQSHIVFHFHSLLVFDCCGGFSLRLVSVVSNFEFGGDGRKEFRILHHSAP
ncbi:hypothetical protein SLA2020_014480 [Shorea laevis]